MKERNLFKHTIENKIADKETIRYNAKNSVGGKKLRRVPVWKKGLVAAIICAIVGMGAVTGLLASFSPNDNNLIDAPKTINAYAEIYQVIENFNAQQNSFNVDNFFGGLVISKSFDSAPNQSESITSSDNSVSYGASSSDRTSETNVQTQGMDEGDIIKVKGQYIYKLNSTGCAIINAVNGNMTLSASISVESYVPMELYISDDGNKLVMIGGIYDYSYSDNLLTRTEPMYDCYYYINYSKTNIRVYDVTNKSAPLLEREVTVDGDYFTSRLEQDTNRLYYILNYYFYYGNQEKYIPVVSDSMSNGGEAGYIASSSIYYYDDIANTNYMIIGYIDLDEPQTDAKQAAYLGLSGTIYVSSDNIFVATYDYNSAFEKNLFGWIRSMNDASVKTRIVKISLADLEQKALTRIDGTIKDRYSLDEYNGYLRVAATVSNKGVSNSVYVLDATLTLTDKIEGIAPNETIYACRFNGETGTIVTFRQTDPVYRLDLKDPYDINISEGLKKPGVSYYIHYIEGTDYTIGIGRSINPNSQWVEWTGLEIVLYYNDPSDPLADPVIVKELLISGNCYAEILNNPKALLYDKETGILAFAYEKWNYSYNYYYSSVEQGLAVFSFDMDAENDGDKLNYRGTLSNIPSAVNLSNNYDAYYNYYWSFISRGIFIGDYIYTISDQYITSYSLTTLAQVDKINLRNTAE
ncbi:MAG: hypothetical protein EOM87_04260 [Clostridia bacterium]|nr:hypothetical protein [Clostridia bacterium]